MKYKLLVTDFDNTLYRTDHTISQGTLDAIREYERRGGTFAICSGRMTVPLINKIKKFGFHGFTIGYQGGELANIDSGEILNSLRMDEEKVFEVIKDLTEKNYYYHLYDGEKLYVSSHTKVTDYYVRENEIKENYIQGDAISFIRDNNLKINKIVFITDIDSFQKRDYAKLEEAMNDYARRFPYLSIVSTSTFLIEALQKEYNKGNGVKNLAEKLGISREEIICVGDASNDVSMIEYAGLGIAVGNATHDLKSVADVIAPTCDENAVGWIIENYCK